MSNKINVKKIDRIIILIFPIIMGLITTLLLPRDDMNVGIGIENCKMMLDIWGVMLGFIITALSILLTVHENRFVNMLIDTGHFSTVLFSYIICCLYLFASIVAIIVIIFAEYWNDNVYLIFRFMITATLISLGICIYFLFRIIFSNIQ